MRTFDIEDGIPVPKVAGRGPRGGLTATLRALKPGQSVFVPNKDTNRVSSMATKVRKATGIKFTVRATEKDGIQGVRVWRLE